MLIESIAKKAIAKVAAKSATFEAATKIIEKGASKIKALESVSVDKLGNKFIQEVKSQAAKNEIEKLGTKTRYTKKEAERLRNMFNLNHLKSKTYQYIDLNIERIVVGDTTIDKNFQKRITVGTLADTPLTRVRNIGRELNKTLSGYNKAGSRAQEQIYYAFTKLPPRIMQDYLDPGKGVDLSSIAERDADILIEVLRNVSEVTDLPRNVEARKALKDWQGEALEEAEEIIAESNEDMEIPEVLKGLGNGVNFVILYKELQRMYDRLQYDSDEERVTNMSYYDFREEVWGDNNNINKKAEYVNELLNILRGNRLPTPNARGTEDAKRSWGSNAEIMPSQIDSLTYNMTVALRELKAKKMNELGRA